MPWNSKTAKNAKAVRGKRSRPTQRRRTQGRPRSKGQPDPEKAVKAVSDFVGQLFKDGKALSVAKLQKQLGGSRFQVHKIVRDQLAESYPLLDPVACETARKLESKYPALWNVIVVRQPPSADPDATYRRLGKAGARFLRLGLIRDRDNIGVGSGRAVEYVARSLANSPKLKPANVKLRSLTGYAFTGIWRNGDDNTKFLRDAFENPDDPSFIDQKLSFTNPHELDIARNKTWLAEAKVDLDLAIVGVGTVNVHHRFLSEAASGDAPLRALHNDLKRLKRLCSKFPSAVADVSNHIYYVPSGVIVNENDIKEKELLDCIAAINSQMLCAGIDVLRRTKALFLVAGSKEKAPAIHQLLIDSTLNVRYLCVDEAAADALLAMPDPANLAEGASA